MFLPRPQTFTTPLLDHHTPLKLFPKHKAVLQVQLQALRVSLSWEDFQSLLHTKNPHYTITTLDSPAASTSQHMTEADEEKYQQAEVYLDQRQIRRHKRQYEKDTRDVSPSRYPSTP